MGWNYVISAAPLEFENECYSFPNFSGEADDSIHKRGPWELLGIAILLWAVPCTHNLNSFKMLFNLLECILHSKEQDFGQVWLEMMHLIMDAYNCPFKMTLGWMALKKNHLRNSRFRRSGHLAHASIPLAQTPWGLTGRAWLQAEAQRVVIVVLPPLNSLGIDSRNDMDIF